MPSTRRGPRGPAQAAGLVLVGLHQPCLGPARGSREALGVRAPLRSCCAREGPGSAPLSQAALLPDLGPLSSLQLVWSLLAPGAGCSPVWLVSGPHPSVGPTAGPARAGTWGSRCSPRCSGGAEWSS